MRILLGLIVTLALGWSGYWFVGSTAQERILTTWFEDRRSENWLAQYSALNVVGFPNRFDTKFENIELVDPVSGLGWFAPFFEVYTLSYKPNHIIAAWPETQKFVTPEETIIVNASELTASIVFHPNTRLGISRTAFSLLDVAIDSTLGWTTGFGTAQFASRQLAANDNQHEIAFTAEDVRPSPDVLAQLDPAGLLPKTLEVFDLQTKIGFTAPWDITAIERGRPQISQIDLNNLTVVWGKMELRSGGSFSVDNRGIPNGSVTVKANNWQDIVALGVTSGIYDQRVADTIVATLGAIAKVTGNPNTLDVKLTFSNGTTYYGIVPLGPSPLFYLR